MQETIESQESQPKRKLVLGKNWFHATRRSPGIRKNSSIPGTGNEREEKYIAYLYDVNAGGSCCVGTYLNAVCKFKPDTLNGRLTAVDSAIRHILPEEAQWLTDDELRMKHSDDAGVLYEANDGRSRRFSEDLTPEEFAQQQRKIIRETFAKHNVEVIFEDEQTS